MKTSTLKAIDLDNPAQKDIWAHLENYVSKDAKVLAELYVKSAKVDLGGE